MNKRSLGGPLHFGEKVSQTIAIEEKMATRCGPIERRLMSTVDGNVENFGKRSFVKSLTKTIDLYDYWSQGLSTDLRPVGRSLVGQGPCLLPSLSCTN